LSGPTPAGGRINISCILFQQYSNILKSIKTLKEPKDSKSTWNEMIECRKRHEKLKTCDKTRENRIKDKEKQNFERRCGGLCEKGMDLYL
jgi:hypothetical protein